MSALKVGQRVSKPNPVPGWPDTVHIVRQVDIRVPEAPLVPLIEITAGDRTVFVTEDMLRPTQRHVENDVEQLPLFGGLP